MSETPPVYERNSVLFLAGAVVAVSLTLLQPFITVGWPGAVREWLALPGVRFALIVTGFTAGAMGGYVLGRRHRPYSGPLFKTNAPPSAAPVQIESALERDIARRTRIQAWREAITAADFSRSGPGGFGDTAAYSSLRPFLDPQFVRAFEGRTAFLGAAGRGPNGAKHHLLDAVARIEREWGLV